ncbi:extracellular solute-binding protein [Roseomonas sp. M0104]|uniref:sn-glycerol-3-phosphate-binding periplasmic protein UgpB n=1 Tax=Teichococcus coralli TaxID=2545983 RepID=A0A845B6B2_9PROT|nr:extracellular solute-binding protein [Pseudoroseomonas coralli]MXP62205.1 extracellular solute-binding protein [Pseudoroseomonas coralli]
MKFRLTALAAGLALTLGAPDARAQQRQNFTFWYGLTGQLSDVVQEVCKRFNNSQDRYQITCTSQGDYAKALQNTIAAFRAGEQPTVVQVYDIGTADLMLSGQYLPARELMSEQSHEVDWSNYIAPIAAYYANSKGEMLSFPFNSSTAVMYWHRGEGRKVGFENPPATWEELHKALVALKQAGSQCPMSMDFDSWALFEQFTAAHNIPVASKDNGYGGLDAEYVFDSQPLVKQHLNNLLNWYQDGLVKVRTAESGQNVIASFASGDCAVTFGSIASHQTVRLTAKEGLDWTPALLPVYAGHERYNTRVGGASLWALKGRPQAEYKGAAAFFAFLATPESEEFWSTRTGYVPVTRAGYERMKDEGFFERPENVGREVAMQSLLLREPTPLTKGLRLGNLTQFRAAYANEMQAAFAGQKTMDQALASLQEQGNQLLRRFQQTYRSKTLP